MNDMTAPPPRAPLSPEELARFVPEAKRPAWEFNWRALAAVQRRSVRMEDAAILAVMLQTAAEWVAPFHRDQAAVEHVKMLRLVLDRVDAVDRASQRGGGPVAAALQALLVAVANAEATLARWAFREQHEETQEMPALEQERVAA